MTPETLAMSLRALVWSAGLFMIGFLVGLTWLGIHDQLQGRPQRVSPPWVIFLIGTSYTALATAALIDTVASLNSPTWSLRMKVLLSLRIVAFLLGDAALLYVAATRRRPVLVKGEDA